MILALLLALAQNAAPPTDALRFDLFRVKDRIEADGRAARTVEVSVLLRTPPAVAQAGQISMLYVDGYGEVSFQRIKVQKPGGSPREVTDAKLEDLNPFGINSSAIPVDIRIKKLTIPGLEPGDKLSYVVVASQKPFTPGEAYGEMKFAQLPLDGPQSYELDMPAVSRLRVTVRPDLEAQWETLASEPDRLVRRMSYTVPPMVIGRTGLTEAQARSLQTPDVSFTTFVSWADVGKWWWDMSRPQVQGDQEIKKEALRIVAGKTTPRDKVGALAAFVGSTIRYLNVSFGIGRMQPRAAGAVLSTRYGDCKDKVGLLMAMADAVGIEVRPVLINSARYDLDDSSPAPSQFDHVIATAILGPEEKDWVWMDVTNSLSSPTHLFGSLRDKRALWIDRNGQATVVRTPARPPFPMIRLVEMKAALSPEGLLKGHIRVDDRTDQEPNLRASFASVAPEQHPELARSVAGSLWKEARLSNVKTSDPGDLLKPLLVEFDFERDVTSIDAEKEWKFWIPDFGPVLMEPDEDQTAKKAVYFGPNRMTFKAAIELPEDVTARAPLSVSLQRPFASLVSSYSVEGRTLRVERVMDFPLPFIARDQVAAYDALRKSADRDREQDFTIAPVKMAAPTALALQKQGKAAWNQKDNPKAIELLQKAIALDPKLGGVYYDLALAFRESDKLDDEVAALAKAIELDPFHENAYGERAYALFELDRPEDAEKDLLKQIEVSPFKEWSYRRLARYRKSQQRYKEAADLFAKSLTIDPKPVSDWLELGWSHGLAGNKVEARAAFAKADELGLATGQRIYAARGYARIGDHATAATLARKDLPDLQKKLEAITDENFPKQMTWSDRMVEAWGVIGTAALRTKDLKTAESYLKASWEAGLSPDVGLDYLKVLIALGRPDEAASVLSAVVGMRPAIFGEPETLAVIKQLGSHAVKATSEAQGQGLKWIDIPAPPSSSPVSENVTVLVRNGKVTVARVTATNKAEALEPLTRALVGRSAPWFSPGGEPATIVRDGWIGCGTLGCRFFAYTETVPLPAAGPAASVGKIRIASITPGEDKPLIAGSTVPMKVRIEYTLDGEKPGQVALYADDDRRTSLLRPQLRKPVQPGSGVAEFAFNIVVPAESTEIRIHTLVAVGIASTKTTAEARFKVQKQAPAAPHP